jgi:hypothetical protein
MANEPGWYSGSTKSSIAPRDSAAVFQKQHIRRTLMPHNYIRDTNGCRSAWRCRCGGCGRGTLIVEPLVGEHCERLE